jgi:tight adherence protein B
MNLVFFSASVLAALAVFFGVAWYGALSAERAKTEVQRRQDRVNEEANRRRRGSLRDRSMAKIRATGWQGPLSPVLWSATMLYLAAALGLSVFGIDGWVGVLFALPTAATVVWLVFSAQHNRRQRAFRYQLVAAFDQLASQLRASAAPAKALEAVVPGLPEPLRSEFVSVLEQHRSARPLTEAMEEVAKRYPSRAMHMFVGALRIDEARGGKLAPVLEEAAATLRRDFELAAESNAEITQERMQFFGIVGIVALIVLSTFGRADAESREAFTSPLGVALLSAFLANFAFGIVRVLRLFSKAKGGW